MPTEILTFRASAATLFLILLWTAEGTWPMFAGREQRGVHYAGNVTLGIFNAVAIAAIFAGGLLFSTEHAAHAGFGLLHWIHLPSPIEWILAVVIFDAWQYAWHVLNHKIPLLWRFHAVHHTDGEMDASTAFRFHTGEIALSSMARIFVLPLLGLSMTHLAVYETALLPVVMFHHSNLKVPRQLDRALRMLVVTPWMHWVHHSDYQPETDSNFSSIFSFWDRLFRTFCIRPDPENIHLGLEGFSESEWKSLGHLIRIPFVHTYRPPRPPTP